MNRNISAVLGGLAAVFVVLTLLAVFTGAGTMGGMGQMMNGGMMGGGAMGLLFMLLFWGVFVALIVGVVRLLTSRR